MRRPSAARSTMTSAVRSIACAPVASCRRTPERLALTEGRTPWSTISSPSPSYPDEARQLAGARRQADESVARRRSRLRSASPRHPRYAPTERTQLHMKIVFAGTLPPHPGGSSVFNGCAAQRADAPRAPDQRLSHRSRSRPWRSATHSPTHRSRSARYIVSQFETAPCNPASEEFRRIEGQGVLLEPRAAAGNVAAGHRHRRQRNLRLRACRRWRIATACPASYSATARRSGV